MADVVKNDDLLNEFEAGMAEETGIAEVEEAAKAEVALTSEEDLDGFASCFASWDIIPNDIPKK